MLLDVCESCPDHRSPPPAPTLSFVIIFFMLFFVTFCNSGK
jgi:hypothetical protein